MRAVIYARISEDHERAESVPTQIANGTKYAERMGWDVVRVFKDKGLSGYTGELRPEFEEMIKFLGGGQADVLIARHHDRLTRNPEDFARLMQVCGKAKIKISLDTGGGIGMKITGREDSVAVTNLVPSLWTWPVLTCCANARLDSRKSRLVSARH